MDSNNKQQVVVIGDPGDLICAEVITVLHHRKDFCVRNINSSDNLSLILPNDFQGFIIISLPSMKLNEWSQHFFKNGMRNYFSIYYYNSFYAASLSRSMYLELDFIIAGKQRKENLSNILNYLRENYWRKIPYSLLQLENGSMTNTMRRILFSLETLNGEDLTLEKMGAKLKFPKSFIRQEIKKAVDMNFSDLKKLVFDYYQKNYPEHFIIK